MTTSKQEIYSLDLLKGLAAVLIVFHHYQQVFMCRFTGINFYDGIFNFGYLVELYFMISGFLAVYTLKLRNSGGYCRSLLHKLVRIYPMYWLALTFSLIVRSADAWLAGDAEKLVEWWNVKALISNYGLLFKGWPFFALSFGVNNPAWYLCILIQCYLIFYLLIWLSGKLKNINLALFTITVVLSVVLRKTDIICAESFRGIAPFFMGCMIADILPNLREKWNKCLIFLSSSVLVSAFIVMAAFCFAAQRWILLFGIYPELIVVAYCLRGWKSERIKLFGKVSFEVYLWHYPMMAFLRFLAHLLDLEVNHSYGSMVCFTLLIGVIGWMLFVYVETPINNRIRSCRIASQI